MHQTDKLGAQGIREGDLTAGCRPSQGLERKADHHNQQEYFQHKCGSMAKSLNDSR
jgi:hypothetical protein